MAIEYLDAKRIRGLSGDTKPTNVPTGSIFMETNTQLYFWWDGSDWTRKALVTATGGTITEVGDYAIHSFTTVGSSSFVVSKMAAGSTIQVLVLAGGGGGGASNGPMGGGGGAGGLCYQTGRAISVGTYTLTVGDGGTGGRSSTGACTVQAVHPNNGGNSTFDGTGTTITSLGGGRGYGYNDSTPSSGDGDGGSGGGGTDSNKHSGNTFGTGDQADSGGATGYGGD